ncbi:hypothetical protein MMC16_007401 [Acarospora aff. strigata]|nr:hypothetical protein [Acarospora aff. strigata]
MALLLLLRLIEVAEVAKTVTTRCWRRMAICLVVKVDLFVLSVASTPEPKTGVLWLLLRLGNDMDNITVPQANELNAIVVREGVVRVLRYQGRESVICAPEENVREVPRRFDRRDDLSFAVAEACEEEGILIVRVLGKRG